MFSFIAAVYWLAWIRNHLMLTIGIVAGLIILIAVLVHRSRSRRRAYLALPVLFIGNKATKTYHVAGCPQLARIIPENRIAFRLPAETTRLGYRPCGVCSPRLPSDD